MFCFMIRSPFNDHLLQVNWWRSQGVRFLLRWPSAYLCHILNFARHQAYGQAVAEAVLKSNDRGGVDQGGTQAEGHKAGPDPRIAELLASFDSHQDHCDADNRLCAIPDSSGLPGAGAGPVDPQPFIPRPIMRVHVRGSDKAREMKLLGARTYFKTMERLRRTSGVPFTSVWLSSEEQVRCFLFCFDSFSV